MFIIRQEAEMGTATPKKQELISSSPRSCSAQRWSRWMRWTVGIFLFLLLAYAGICVTLALLQRSMIFDGMQTQGTPRAQLRVEAPAQLIHLSLRNGTLIVGIFVPVGAMRSSGLPATRPEGTESPTVLFFYGNGGCVARCAEVMEIMCNRLSCNVLMVDYPGYGMSGGVANETNCYAAADAALDWLLAREDVDHRRIVYIGDSLGAAVAIDLASRRPPDALITLGAFTSMPAEAHHLFPWLPTSLILVYRFDNIDKMKKITCPILLLHGTQDTDIPCSMAGDLAAAAHHATVILVPGDHNAIISRGSPAWDHVEAFLRSPNAPAGN
jgi:hypothetical protein